MGKLKEIEKKIGDYRKVGDYVAFLDETRKVPGIARGFYELAVSTFGTSKTPDVLADVYFELIIGTPIKPPIKEGAVREIIFGRDTTTLIRKEIPIPQKKIIDQITEAYDRLRFLKEGMIPDLFFILRTIKLIMDNWYGSTYFTMSSIEHRRKTRGELFEIATDIRKVLDPILEDAINQKREKGQQILIDISKETKKNMTDITNAFMSHTQNAFHYPIQFVKAFCTGFFNTPQTAAPGQAPTQKKEVLTTENIPNVAGNLADTTRKKERKRVVTFASSVEQPLPGNEPTKLVK